MRILIAEDDTPLRVAMRLVLEDAAFRVVEVSDAGQVAARLAEHPLPDAIVIDAGGNGLGTTVWSELVRQPDWAGRALLVTGNVAALGALAAHPDVLAKPFDYGALVARFRAMGPRGTPLERRVGRGTESA